MDKIDKLHSNKFIVFLVNARKYAGDYFLKGLGNISK